MPLLAPVTRTALETVGSLACVCSPDCAGAHSSTASNAHIVVRSTRMAASLLRTEVELQSSAHRRTHQTAHCIGPAIRCMTDLTDDPGSRVRVAITREVKLLFRFRRIPMLRAIQPRAVGLDCI